MLWFLVVYVVQGVIFGVATNKVIENKGYNENWFWWGFFFGFIALIVALSKTDINASNYAASAQYEKKAAERRTSNMLDNNGWKCNRCGRVNPNYTGTCGCGISRAESEKWLPAPVENGDSKDDIQKLKSYKELLDTGVITQEEFDAKKKELLGL